MKIIWSLLLAAALLSGCQSDNKELQEGLRLRDNLLSAESTEFTAEITADYGSEVRRFVMDCQADAQGNIQFCVTDPETIAGITGKLSSNGGELTFDDKALYFDYITDDQLSPVSAPWIFLNTLRGGYLKSAGRDGEYLHLLLDDSYEEDSLMVEVWVDASGVPARGDIFQEGRRILAVTVTDFVIR